MHNNRIWNRPTALAVALSSVLFATAVRAQKSDDRTPAAVPLPPPFRLADAKWGEPYSGPLGFPKGAQRVSLGTDPRTGGETYYARFPAGTRFAPHWHAHGEYAVVLRGRVTHVLGKERHLLVVGDYVVVPAKVPHGWEVDPGDDVYLLIRRDGPADFNFVGR